ncbi:MAG: hypothetical protein ACYCPT_01960 [Acidimicrobiales bacterium]
MYLPKLELRGWNEYTVQERKISLAHQCESLIAHNVIYIRKHPELLHMYDYPLKYIMKKRPGDIDSWQDIPQTIALGGGDCKDFSCWLVAWERCMREYFPVHPWITDHEYKDPEGRRPPITLYHVRVQLGTHIEDPSAHFGMPTQVSYDELRA